jgi:hypothetical protein
LAEPLNETHLALLQLLRGNDILLVRPHTASLLIQMIPIQAGHKTKWTVLIYVPFMITYPDSL